MHEALNLTEITLVALAAVGGGILLERFRQPAVLGYILAGVILGPSLFGFVENRSLVHTLAELGVLMLLFLIGLELRIKSFKAVWKVAVLTTFAQLTASILIVSGLGQIWGISWVEAFLIGSAFALSSTAVAVKMLQSMNELRTPSGEMAVGILIAQDLALVPIIILLRGFSGDTMGYFIFIKLIIAICLLVALIWYFGQRQKIHLPFSAIIADHHDLTPLVGLAVCFGAAAICGLLGLSAAYGAFLGGLILGNTTAHHKMHKATQPIQSVLMMVFFLSIGLLMDLNYIWNHLSKVLTFLALLTIGKSIFNIFILRVLGQSYHKAFLAGLVISQMGEFAFLLAALGIKLHILDHNDHNLIISLATLSLALSPLWLKGARRFVAKAPRHIANIQEATQISFGTEIAILNRIYSFCTRFSSKGQKNPQTDTVKDIIPVTYDDPPETDIATKDRTDR